jgi:hypothetical protein
MLMTRPAQPNELLAEAKKGAARQGIKHPVEIYRICADTIKCFAEDVVIGQVLNLRTGPYISYFSLDIKNTLNTS